MRSNAIRMGWPTARNGIDKVNAMPKFDVPLEEEAEVVIDKVKTLISQHGGTLQGDASKGSFEGMTPAGMIRGVYEIAGRTATIDIHDKPWMLSQAMIEQTLREYFTSKPQPDKPADPHKEP
jgi:hypothetical protein